MFRNPTLFTRIVDFCVVYTVAIPLLACALLMALLKKIFSLKALGLILFLYSPIALIAVSVLYPIRVIYPEGECANFHSAIEYMPAYLVQTSETMWRSVLGMSAQEEE